MLFLCKFIYKVNVILRTFQQVIFKELWQVDSSISCERANDQGLPKHSWGRKIVGSGFQNTKHYY